MLLTSCAWLPWKKGPPIDPSTALKSICWNGNGKGKVRFYSEKSQFRFESALDPQQQKWSLALSLPVLGEEVLEYYYHENQDNVFLRGGLWLRWQRELKSSPKGALAMTYYKIKDLGPYFVWQQGANSFFRCSPAADSDVTWSCPLSGGRNLTLEMEGENLKISMPANGHTVLLNYKKRKNGFYQEAQILFQDQDANKSQAPFIDLRLYFDSCQSST